MSDEIQIGREMAAKLLGRLKLYKGDAAASEYVTLVGQSLAQRVGRTELSFHFAILNTNLVNAYATPGGYIFVTRGLLCRLRSEDELAGVLGHEIAHVNEKHMYTEIRPDHSVSAGETLVRLFSHGGSELGVSLSQIADRGVDILLGAGPSAEKELAADEAGTVYAAGLGYNPLGLTRVLERIGHERQSGRLTHGYPAFPARLRRLKKFLIVNGFKNSETTDPKVLTERFQRSLAGLTSLGTFPTR